MKLKNGQILVQVALNEESWRRAKIASIKMDKTVSEFAQLAVDNFLEESAIQETPCIPRKHLKN